MGERGAVEQGKEAGFVAWFSELSNKDVGIAGGKGASLAEMYNNHFPIPPGFVITANAYQHFLDSSKVTERIKELLTNLDVENTKQLENRTAEIRALIENASLEKEMGEAICEAYDILDLDKNKIEHARGNALDILRNSHELPFVAVRSSATTEDLADSSFAGQQETFLNVKGKEQLLEKVKQCFASLFTARAVYYRTKKGFDHLKARLAIVVQRMIDSEKSGVMFSRNPVGTDENIVIEAVWGLGEGIVSGRIKPDYYRISKKEGESNIKEIIVTEKKVAITRDASGATKIVPLTKERSKQQVLTEHELKLLANYARQLEEHYEKPQDIEFAIAEKQIYIVQSRPITVFFEEKANQEIKGNILLSGLGASPGIAVGKVTIVHSIDELSKVQKGDVLVAVMTNPDMVVTMQKAKAIITDEGGVTSHAAIVSREMGIPCVVGTEKATAHLQEGQIVTVDGSTGKVYEGEGETKTVEIKKAAPTRLKLKVIVDLPEFAERAAKTGLKAAGLVRLEGIIAASGKHPFFFVHKKDMHAYEELLLQGLKKIAHPFEEIWVRTSDLRSDEFSNLEGAPKEVESNPMLGDHGIRFSIKHKDILTAEVSALIRLAKELPNKIFGIMIPQIISVSELQETKRAVLEIGARPNLKVGIMVETPAAVQLINQICEEGIQFISFGTNDLTQYTLALDRNNASVQALYNEMHPAVISSLRYVIRRCKKYGVETSICGQAGSKEEMVRFLLGEGIDSISVNADAAEHVSTLVAQLESEINKQLPINSDGK